jgi:general secretion pathway protein K
MCQMRRAFVAVRREDGVALMITLVIITLVAVVVLDLNYLMRVDVHASANFRDGIRSYYLAKSGITLVNELFGPKFQNVQELEQLKNTLLAGGSQTLPLGDGQVALRVMDETGKINVNALVIDIVTAQQQTAQPQPVQPQPGQQPGQRDPQLTSPWIQITQDLFQRLGIDPNLVGAIVDWIDLDDIPTGSGGAESNYYRTLEKPYTARNGPMETIAELRLVRGFTDEVLLKLGAKRVGGVVDPATNTYLTAIPLTQGGGWRVNLNTAPPLLLSSLTREGGQFTDLIVQRRTQGRIENINELQQLGITGEVLQDFQRLGTLTSSYYAIEALGTVGDIAKQITALVMVQTGGQQGNQILYWRVQ